MKTVFHVEHGEVIVTGFQLTIQDFAGESGRRGGAEVSPLFLTRERS